MFIHFHGSRYDCIYTYLQYVNIIKGPCNEENHSTVAYRSKDRIELDRRKIIRQRKVSMRSIASHFGFFVVIALCRNFILFKKVGRISEFKTLKLFRLKYNSFTLGYNL